MFRRVTAALALLAFTACSPAAMNALGGVAEVAAAVAVADDCHHHHHDHHHHHGPPSDAEVLAGVVVGGLIVADALASD